MPIWESFKHAFAVESPQPVQPTPEQQAVLDPICREVVRRGLTAPALIVLEMSRPLNYVGAQGLHFLAPIIEAVTDRAGHRHVAAFLEQRQSIAWLCERIEACQREADASRRDSQQGQTFSPETAPPPGEG